MTNLEVFLGEPLAISPLSGLDPVKETCLCRSCRSDMAYLVPCDYADVIEFTLINSEKGLDYEPEQENSTTTAS